MGAKPQKIFMLTQYSQAVIINGSTTFGFKVMTFSEYIATLAYAEYLEYCRQNNLVPDIDVEIKRSKLCALVKPKPTLKDDKT